MVFSSTLFIFCFLPLTLLLYLVSYKSRKIGIANAVLLLMSIIFYAWGGLGHFLVLLAVVALNYLLTMAMVRFTICRKWLFVLILFIDIGNLLYFKYFNFFVENVRIVLNRLGIQALEGVASVALPIGISFYTFQIISYVADVYMGKVEVQKSPVKMALYVMMFPQLIAGPIVRYKDVNEEINGRTITAGDIEDGIKRFIIGFFKKVFIANAMGNMADTVFGLTGNVNTGVAWLGAVCYSLQIYYDFSAYSDMAIGIGRMLGFHFNENFELPYKSQSIQEFWRRWHISLSTWFRDYVYIPLGGNRKGRVRTYLNLVVVFFLTGFWHGAAWQFIVWGIYHGFFSIIERLGLNSVLAKIPRALRHIYTMLVVVVGWVFFRADNISQALNYLKNMFVPNFTAITYPVVSQATSIFGICLIIAVFFSVTRLECLQKLSFWSNRTFVRVRYLLLWIVSALYLTGLQYNPFIYFKF